ncbi:hypothetical protein ACFL2Q_09930 [Thermodesulfobacteriota bacterium]
MMTRRAKGETLEITRRYLLLTDQGKTSKEAARIVNEEFNKNLKDSSFRKYATQYKDQLAERDGDTASPNVDEQYEGAEHKEPAAEDVKQPEPDEQNERDDQQPIPETEEVETAVPDHWESRMRAIANEVCNELMNTVHTIHIKSEGNDMPPEAITLKGVGRGRKENRKYDRITVTVDKILMELAKKEAKDRRTSIAKIVDAALWVRYGKPKLSYMTEDE